MMNSFRHPGQDVKNTPRQRVVTPRGDATAAIKAALAEGAAAERARLLLKVRAFADEQPLMLTRMFALLIEELESP